MTPQDADNRERRRRLRQAAISFVAAARAVLADPLTSDRERQFIGRIAGNVHKLESLPSKR